MTKAKHLKSIFDGVLRFQQAQFKELRKPKNMSKPHWCTTSNDKLYNFLEDKMYELDGMISDSKVDVDRQKKLCADIGNYAMMILDNLGGNK